MFEVENDVALLVTEEPEELYRPITVEPKSLAVVFLPIAIEYFPLAVVSLPIAIE